jgi:hypothetical protein
MNDRHHEVSHGPASVASNPTLSRRTFLKASITGAGLAGAAGGLASCMTSPYGTRTAGTTPKTVARYQDLPNRGRRCAGCTHFLEPSACEIVAGDISPNGWCRFHEPRPT